MNFLKTPTPQDIANRRHSLALNSGFFFSLILIATLSTAERAFSIEHPVHIGIFDSGSGSSHESDVLNTLRSFLSSSKKVQISSYPIYDSKGRLIEKNFINALKKAKTDRVQIFHFSWNLPSSSKTKSLESALAELAKDSNRVIIAAAGTNTLKPQKPLPLSKTVWGKFPSVLIVGELNAANRLEDTSNYGPELLTAFPSIESHRGSSFTSLLLTAELAKRAQKESLSELRMRVLKNSKNFEPSIEKPFPSLKDLFNL